MTEKEKVKAYDEAIERAKKSYGNRIAEEIFPELKESKDKKIREAILNSLIDCRDVPDLGWSNFGGIHIDDCIAWLEKQGEQNLPSVNERTWLYLVSDVLTWKDGIGQYLDDPRVQELAKKLCSEYAQKLYNPSVLSNSPNTEKNEQKSANKIEPRFKVGDWVVQNYNLLKIRYVGNEYYCFETVDAYVDYMLVSEIDSLYHLWTIQDAKVGDVLEFEDHGRLVIGILSRINKTTGKVDVSCLLEDNKFKLGVFYNLNTISPHPAIKEQRDILMKAMNDAGYEWNAGTKTLEKLVEPKFKVGDKIVNLPMKYMGGSWTQGTISKITDDKYIFTDGSYISISSQDSWELVPDKKSKFDPKTLQPFDKVLARDYLHGKWTCGFFSHIVIFDNTYMYNIGEVIYKMCIPYNDETKHLVGTTEEAPEYYSYWED